MPPQVYSQLQTKNKCFCVSCKEPIEMWQEVTSKRSGNNLRIRCMPCSKKFLLWSEEDEKNLKGYVRVDDEV
tara:strand:+ start:1668 stop:1883 length:216 start_codon:yes stop_codon:yes gene_type:complete